MLNLENRGLYRLSGVLDLRISRTIRVSDLKITQTEPVTHNRNYYQVVIQRESRLPHPFRTNPQGRSKRCQKGEANRDDDGIACSSRIEVIHHGDERPDRAASTFPTSQITHIENLNGGNGEDERPPYATENGFGFAVTA